LLALNKKENIFGYFLKKSLKISIFLVANYESKGYTIDAKKLETKIFARGGGAW